MKIKSLVWMSGLLVTLGMFCGNDKKINAEDQKAYKKITSDLFLTIIDYNWRRDQGKKPFILNENMKAYKSTYDDKCCVVLSQGSNCLLVNKEGMVGFKLKGPLFETDESTIALPEYTLNTIKCLKWRYDSLTKAHDMTLEVYRTKYLELKQKYKALKNSQSSTN